LIRAPVCRSEEEQRDALLRARGGASKAFGEERSPAYYLE